MNGNKKMNKKKEEKKGEAKSQKKKKQTGYATDFSPSILTLIYSKRDGSNPKALAIFSSLLLLLSIPFKQNNPQNSGDFFFFFFWGHSALLLFLCSDSAAGNCCANPCIDSRNKSEIGEFYLSRLLVPPPRLLVHKIFPAFHTHLDWSPPSIPCWLIDFPARREADMLLVLLVWLCTSTFNIYISLEERP